MIFIIDPVALQLLGVGLLAYLGRRLRIAAKKRTSGSKS
jgi:hypothetical protein